MARRAFAAVIGLAAAACGRSDFNAQDDAGGDARVIDGLGAPASTQLLALTTPPATLTDFPLPVTLTDANSARDLIDATGSNIRFLDSTNAVLPYEVETLGVLGTGAPTVIWVRVPTVDVGTTLTLELGGTLPAASSQSVWSSEYEAVYHCVDNHDATGRHDGVFMNPVTPDIGEIGGSLHFDGTSSMLVADAQSLDFATGATISGWIYQSGFDTQQETIASREIPGSAAHDFFLGTYDTQTDVTESYTGGSTEASYQATSITTGHWTHIALTSDSAKLIDWLDGNEQGFTATGGGMIHSAESIVLGAEISVSTTPNVSFLAGNLDEVRFEHIARPGQWISYDHGAQSDAVITYGPVTRM
jgi:hypothetical protein